MLKVFPLLIRLFDRRFFSESSTEIQTEIKFEVKTSHLILIEDEKCNSKESILFKVISFFHPIS